MTIEKRRFSRIAFQHEAELRFADRSIHTPGFISLSVGGCQLDIGEELSPGTTCQLVIPLKADDPEPPVVPLQQDEFETNVEVDGEITRSSEGLLSIKFTAISHEALLHLQNIIRYNSKDLDRIEREINDHPGLI